MVAQEPRDADATASSTGRAATGRHWPVLIAIALQLSIQGAQLAVAIVRGGGFAYPLDDAYIHLAMARTLAEHGTLGITGHAFASSSSSPAWLLLLAGGIELFGAVVWLPLALATLAAVLLLIAVDASWRRLGAADGVRSVGLLLLVLALPLPTLANTGMEHTMHAWLAVLFVDRVARLASERPGSPPAPAMGTLLLLGAALTATRLEGAFLVAPAAWFVLRTRGVLAAGALGAAAALPWTALGLWSWAEGHFFLPNSIVLKGGRVPIPGVGSTDHGVLTGVRALARFGHATATTALLAACLWCGRRSPTGAMRTGLAIALVGMLLHAQFARFGWFFRYEAYLLAAAIAVAVPAIQPTAALLTPRWRRLFWVFVALAIAAFAQRSWRALRDVPRASSHTLRQNVQVAHFLAEHGGGRAIAVNDIGAAAFFARLPTTDLVGLADTAVARARLAGTFDAAFVRQLAAERRVSLAVVYEDWFAGQLPPEWEPLARWTVAPPFWGPTVTFFAVDPADAAHWRAALREASRRLPAGVLSTAH